MTASESAIVTRRRNATPSQREAGKRTTRDSDGPSRRRASGAPSAPRLSSPSASRCSVDGTVANIWTQTTHGAPQLFQAETETTEMNIRYTRMRMLYRLKCNEGTFAIIERQIMGDNDTVVHREQPPDRPGEAGMGQSAAGQVTDWTNPRQKVSRSAPATRSASSGAAARSRNSTRTSSGHASSAHSARYVATGPRNVRSLRRSVSAATDWPSPSASSRASST